MSKYSIEFTEFEIVNLIDCCTQAVVNFEETSRAYVKYGSTTRYYPSYDKDRTERVSQIIAVRQKIINALCEQKGRTVNDEIKLNMFYFQFSELATCCQSTIESKYELLKYLKTDDLINSSNDYISLISDLREKILFRIVYSQLKEARDENKLETMINNLPDIPEIYGDE